MISLKMPANRTDGWTAAHVAAKRGKIAMLKQLLVAGANINIKATSMKKKNGNNHCFFLNKK